MCLRSYVWAAVEPDVHETVQVLILGYMIDRLAPCLSLRLMLTILDQSSMRLQHIDKGNHHPIGGLAADWFGTVVSGCDQ